MTTSVRAFFLSVLCALMVCFLAPTETSAGIKLGVVLPQDGQFDADVAFGIDGRYRIGDRWRVGLDFLCMYYPSDALPYAVNRLEKSRDRIVGIAGLVTGAYFLTDEFYAGAGIGRFEAFLEQDDSPYVTEIDRSAGIAGEIMLGWLYKSPNRHHWLPFVELKYLFQQGASVTYLYHTGEVREFSHFNNLGLYVGLTF